MYVWLVCWECVYVWVECGGNVCVCECGVCIGCVYLCCVCGVYVVYVYMCG